MQYLVIYWIIINFIGALLMWADKRKAIARKWRIPERTLFAVALLGGEIGALFGMYAFHHKTRTLKFVIGFPFILLVHSLLVLIVYKYCLNLSF